MPQPQSDLLVFSDADGCLLDKRTYDFRPALPVLTRLAERNISVVLASSKTAVELQSLASELNLLPAPLICENGGQIVWRSDDVDAASAAPTVLGAERSQILAVLVDLKQRFRFRSFADLGLQGVIELTQLDSEPARAAMDRHCTEPLVWDDHPDSINGFRTSLHDQGLTLTRGGRFWHVAGQTSKGAALRVVVDAVNAGATDGHLRTAAIGDSPIDQSMLDVADFPIAIPTPEGIVDVEVRTDDWIVANHHGPTGWAEAVGTLLDRLGFPD